MNSLSCYGALEVVRILLFILLITGNRDSDFSHGNVIPLGVGMNGS